MDFKDLTNREKGTLHKLYLLNKEQLPDYLTRRLLELGLIERVGDMRFYRITEEGRKVFRQRWERT